MTPVSRGAVTRAAVVHSAVNRPALPGASNGSTVQRLSLYRLVCRIDAMACLPLWHSPAQRDEVETNHREFVETYL